MPSDDQLDELIQQVTVDAYGDEGYWSFLQTFDDDVQFPFSGNLVGIPVVVTGVDLDGDERRGLVAVIERSGRTDKVSLLDVEPEAGDDAALLLAAYKRCLGIS